MLNKSATESGGLKITFVTPPTLIPPIPYLSLRRKSWNMKTFITAIVFLFTAVTGFAQVTFPIELKFFQAQKTSQHNVLRWLAPCTSDFAAFEVQHSSDNQNFTVLHSFTADQIRCAEPFDYTDLQRREGTNYYRIKLTTPANTSVNSFIVAVLNGSKGFALNALLPSLVRSSAVLSISSAETDKLQLIITDISGKRHSVHQEQLQAGSNQVQLNLQSLPAGQYILQASNSKGDQQQLRFLKQ